MLIVGSWIYVSWGTNKHFQLTFRGYVERVDNSVVKEAITVNICLFEPLSPLSGIARKTFAGLQISFNETIIRQVQ